MKIPDNILQSVPKVLLHDHLDGGLRPRTVIELARETALAGVVISLYYYGGVIRAIYWSQDAPADLSPIFLSGPAKVTIAICIAGMFWIGLFPNTMLNLATAAVKGLKM